MYGTFFKAVLVGGCASALVALGINSAKKELNNQNEEVLKYLREKNNVK